MPRVVRKLRRNRRRVVAALVTAVAVLAAVYAIAVAHTWASCHSFTVHSYPSSYPGCRTSVESTRPMEIAGAGSVFLVPGVLATYLWIEDSSVAGRARRRR